MKNSNRRFGLLAGIALSLTALADMATAANMDAAWSTAIKPFMQKGWKPFGIAGYNFDLKNNASRNWGAGFTTNQHVMFVAICDNCQGIGIDIGGVDFAAESFGEATGPNGASVWAEYVPLSTANGHVQFTAKNCKTPVCKIRYASFTKEAPGAAKNPAAHVAGKAAAAPAGVSYIAVGFSNSTGSAFTAWGDNQQQVNASAVANCNKAGKATDCKVVTQGKNTCASIVGAANPNGKYYAAWATRTDRHQAQDAAVKICKNKFPNGGCEVLATKCSADPT